MQRERQASHVLDYHNDIYDIPTVRDVVKRRSKKGAPVQRPTLCYTVNSTNGVGCVNAGLRQHLEKDYASHVTRVLEATQPEAKSHAKWGARSPKRKFRPQRVQKPDLRPGSYMVFFPTNHPRPRA